MVLVLAWAAGARAGTSFAVDSSTVTTLYVGAEYEYVVEFVDTGVFSKLAEILLSESQELVAIEEADGATIWTKSMLQDNCDAPPYDCASSVDDRSMSYAFHPVAADTRQRIDIVADVEDTSWPAFRIRVRMLDGALGCSQPAARFEDFFGGGWDTVYDTAYTPACTGNYHLASLEATPTSATKFRSSANETVVIEATGGGVQGNSGYVGSALITGYIDSSCTPEDLCGSLVSVTSTPLGATVMVLNQPDPPSGDQIVTLTLSHAGASIAVPITIAEGNASSITLTRVDGSSPMSGGQTARFGVTASVNANGGHEPRDVDAWTVTASPEPLVDLASWWLVEGQELVLTPPPDLGLPDGQDALTLTITAAHDNPGDGTVADSVELVVTRDAAARVESCRLRASDDRTELAAGEQVELLLEEQRLGQSAFQLSATATQWSAQPDLGSFASHSTTDGRVLYTAPSTAAAIALTATNAACPGGAATLNAVVVPPPEPPDPPEITPIEELALDSDKLEIDPGGVVRLTGRFRVNPQAAVTGLRLRLAHRGLALVQRNPTASPGLTLRPSAVEEREGETTMVFDLAASDVEHSFQLPAMARATAAGARLKVRLEAYLLDASDDAPQAFADVDITVREEPELSEATLIGKVFHDRNGDGVQQEGEEGFPRAMVGLAAGVYALTDANGAYHVARLAPGRHVVKIDLASLPLGATLTTPERRDLTLTPGIFTKVSFGVRLPDLSKASDLSLLPGGGLRLVDGEPTYRARVRSLLATRLRAQRGDTLVEASREEDGSFTLELPIDADAGHWLLVEQARDGRAWLWSLSLHAYDDPGGWLLVVPRPPRPLMRLLLPPPEAPVRGAKLATRGVLEVDGSYTLSAAAKECGASATSGAELDCELELSPGEVALRLALDAGADDLGDDPPRLTVALPIEVEPSAHFFVGRLGVEVANVAGQRDDDDEPWFWDAGGAFFYRGLLDGKYLVAAGADATARSVLLRRDGGLASWSKISSRLLGHDPRRIFRDLDPEQYYPTYGDASITVDEREAGGRFFFRLQHEQSYLRWGGVNTAIDDAIVGRYVRSLYGFGARLHLDGEDMALRAVAFGAQPESAAARDEVVVTGGSLYFLSHRQLVEGSLRVTLETLDELSGLAIRAVPLTEGLDYEADYAGGRISLDHTIAYRAFGASLTEPRAGGPRHRLIVEYEYLPAADLTTDWSLGARVLGTYGPVSLGLTGVAELDGATEGSTELRSRYELVGATIRLELGKGLRGRVDLAHSTSASHAASRSADGGLTYVPASRRSDGGRNAAAFELTSEGELGRASAYGRFQQRGFSDSHVTPGQRILQGGLRLATELDTRTELWLQGDHRELGREGAPFVARNLLVAGGMQRLGPVKLALEGRYAHAPTDDSQQAYAAAQLGFALSSSWSFTLRRNQRLLASDTGVFSRGPTGETAASALFSDGGWSAGAEVGLTDALGAFGRVQGGVPLDEETLLYVGALRRARLGAMLDPTESEPVADSLLVGGRRGLADGTSLYAEQQLQVDGSERRFTRGTGGDLALGRRTRLSFNYERGKLDPDDVPARSGARDAASIGALFVGDTVEARVLLSGWLDDTREVRSAELGGNARVDWHVTPDLTFALGLRGASAYRLPDDGATISDHAAWEGSAGFALRPLASDDLHVFARYAFVHERLPGSSAQSDASLEQRSHITAFAVVLDVLPRLSLAPKVAYRYTDLTLAEGGASDQALLGALRSDLHFDGWDASVEGRSCSAPGTDDAHRFGALAEASVLVLQWFRLGAGYNFSSISSGAVQCNEAGARGVFVRAEALY